MAQRRSLWLIVGLVGGVLVLLCLGVGFPLLVWGLVHVGTLTTAETLPAAAVVALGLGLGAPLMLHGWAGWQARPSHPFNPARVWGVWLALVLLVGLGAAVSSLPVAPALWLPPIHVLAMALLPLAILWSVGRGLGGTGGSWREVIASIAGGGTLGAVGALVGEGLVGCALAAIVIAVILAVPGGMEQITALVAGLKDLAWQQDLTNLLRLLLSPVVAISALGMFSIPVPLVEEMCKGLAAGVVARWIRPHPARAFLWGVASGAGFALTENLFSGALGGAEGWALGAASRFGATMMHCFTGGLVGWGWGQLWTARRPFRLLIAYAVAVVVHGIWNAAGMGMVLLGAIALMNEGDVLQLTLVSFGTLVLLGVLGLLTLTFALALLLAARKLAAGTG